MLDTLITGGTLISRGEMRKADMGIAGGQITAVLEENTALPARSTIDATGQWVIPGVIDAHFHCRAPGNPAWGDFATESRAAAAGGVTTFLEIPISTPACATPEVLIRRRELGESQSYVNFGLYGGPATLRRRDIEGMVREGVIGFKVFTTEPPLGRDEQFAGLCATDDATLREALLLVRETGLSCSVHSESHALIRHFHQQLRAQGRSDPPAHSVSQPPIVEAIVIAKLIALARELGTRVHIAHLSTELGLESLRSARDRKNSITAETCPQYILFDETALERCGPYAKINPPLRKARDQQALSEAIWDGSIAFVASDHSPFDSASKEVGWKDIWSAPPGAPGVEALLFFILNAAREEDQPVAKGIQLITELPACHFDMYPAKGVLEVGADADVVLIDPIAEVVMEGSAWHSQARSSARLYDGWTGTGKVLRTIVGGMTVFQGGEIVGKAGAGSFVSPNR